MLCNLSSTFFLFLLRIWVFRNYTKCSDAGWGWQRKNRSRQISQKASEDPTAWYRWVDSLRDKFGWQTSKAREVISFTSQIRFPSNHRNHLKLRLLSSDFFCFGTKQQTALSTDDSSLRRTFAFVKNSKIQVMKIEMKWSFACVPICLLLCLALVFMHKLSP